jgi:uncharacterized protein (DUF302 family)
MQNVSVIVKRSQASYSDTVGLLLAAIERRGLTLFSRVDHATGARAVGLQLADEELFMFGNPLSGTPLMQSDPRIGLELPLKMLVWREGADVLVGFRDPREFAGSYDVAPCKATLEQMAALLGDLAAEAAGKTPTS